MPTPHRIRGVKVLKAVSSPLRLQILNLLFDKGPLSYTQLMNSLKLNQSRDAGRFAYHLKFLLNTDLIETDVEARKYCLTELGKMVIDVADRVEKKATKPKGLLVRTSRLAFEEFEVNRIADSLISEAKMPADLAQKAAKETEKRLLKSKIKYLTAPLVREVVNAILIEKGLEEYRHKLTRLGLPVHEVAALIDTENKASRNHHSTLESAGEATLKEYTLLSVFPRDVADAHLSGSIHINALGSWILKPNEAMHDLRFFLRNGINMEKTDAAKTSLPPPQNLESVLSLVFNVLLDCNKETSEAQTLDYFNVFLAPYAKGVESSKIKQALRLFILDLSRHINVSLGIELTIPDFVTEKPAYGPSEKQVGKYGDFTEESQLLASLLLEIFLEESMNKPLLDPRIILKIRPETFTDERAKAILAKAHRQIAERTALHFANLCERNHSFDVGSSSGVKLDADLSKDWEVDTLRTGCLGSVAVNLPRIAYECGKDKAKFFQLLRERLEMASRALEIKYRELKSHGKGLFPFLLQGAEGDQYFRFDHCSRSINLVGLKEAVLAFSGKSIFEDENSFKFAQEIVQDTTDFARKTGRRHGRRSSVTMVTDSEASERMAQSDVERYGVAKVRFSGTREKPFYSTISKFSLSENALPQQSLKLEQKLQTLCTGGNLTVIELGTAEQTPEELMSITRQLIESSLAEFFTYDRKFTYCTTCRKSWAGSLHKCPSCGAVGTLTCFDRFALS